MVQQMGRNALKRQSLPQMFHQGLELLLRLPYPKLIQQRVQHMVRNAPLTQRNRPGIVLPLWTNSSPSTQMVARTFVRIRFYEERFRHLIVPVSHILQLLLSFLVPLAVGAEKRRGGGTCGRHRRRSPLLT